MAILRRAARRYAPRRLGLLAVVLVVLVGSVVTACGASSTSGTGSSSTSGLVQAIGAENQYADVLSQIGGKYVQVTSILNNPNTDPHAFESSPSVAAEVSAAQLIVQNGAGYDSFMNTIESAVPSSSRKIIIAQDVLGLPADTPNPHLWYDPRTMPAVATVMAKDLSDLRPTHASYFAANLAKFNSSLGPLRASIASFKSEFPRVPVAVTEPVADYLLQAMGMKILTPFRFQADVMNGVDPNPEDVTLEDSFLTKHQVKFFAYNQQVVDDLTASIRQAAVHSGVPVVGVYETMPTPGYDYQSWMLAEVGAFRAAVANGKSTEHL
jgi:zinc/manganese transport system substrate-binding protein